MQKNKRVWQCFVEGGKEILKIVTCFVFYRRMMRHKTRLRSSRRIYRKRLGEIEPVFGQIKHNMGVRTLYYKGLENVRTEVLWIATAHNLHKLMKNKCYLQRSFYFFLYIKIITMIFHIFEKNRNKN